MNSKSFLITVLWNIQFANKNLGYYPTTYMIFVATTALFYLPFFASHRFKRILTTNIKNFFSFSRSEIPDKDPIAQQIELRLSNENSDPSIYLSNLPFNSSLRPSSSNL